MFKHDDEYLQATQKAGIYTYDEYKIGNSKLVGFNLLLGALLGGIIYVGFSSNLLNASVLTSDFSKPVFATIDTNSIDKNRNLLEKLSKVEVDSVFEVDKEKEKEQLKLAMAMSQVVNGDNVDNSSYIAALSKELALLEHKTPSQKIRMVTVQKGDTLATLSQRYYGNASKFDKILASNPHINRNSDTIYVGETLALPYQ